VPELLDDELLDDELPDDELLDDELLDDELLDDELASGASPELLEEGCGTFGASEPEHARRATAVTRPKTLPGWRRVSEIQVVAQTEREFIGDCFCTMRPTTGQCDVSQS
jgi:hypothetical protein